MVLLSFFEISCEARFLLHEFIMWSSRVEEGAEECPSWLQDAEWHALRTTSHCGDANLPIRHFSAREREEVLTEPAEDSYQGSSASNTILGCESTREELPNQMRAVAETG